MVCSILCLGAQGRLNADLLGSVPVLSFIVVILPRLSIIGLISKY
jgi:hypothetical protein